MDSIGVLAKLDRVLDIARNVRGTGLPDSAAMVLQRCMFRVAARMAVAGPRFGLHPEFLRAQVYGGHEGLALDVNRLENVGPRSRAFAGAGEVGPDPVLDFDVALTVERGITYSSSVFPASDPVFQSWGAYVLTRVQDLAWLPDGFVVVDTLGPSAYVVKRLATTKPKPVYSGPRRAFWSATEAVRAPWGDGWCHVNSEDMAVFDEAVWMHHPEVEIYLVLQMAPRLVTARVMSLQDQMDVYDAVSAAYVHPTPDIGPAPTWVLVGTTLCSAGICRAVLQHFVAASVCVMDPESTEEWEVIVGPGRDLATTRQLIVCTRPTLACGAMLALAKTRATPVNVIVLTNMFDVETCNMDAAASEVMHTFFQGVPMVRVWTLRNVVRVLQLPSASLWQCPAPPAEVVAPVTDVEGVV